MTVEFLKRLASHNSDKSSELFFFCPLLYPVLAKDVFEGFVHHGGFCVLQLLDQLFELREVGTVNIVGLVLIDALKLFFLFLGAWASVLDQVSP